MQAFPSARHGHGTNDASEISLSERRIVSIQARAGQRLRSESGTVWATVEGRGDDILLRPGETHRLESDARIHLSGFDAAACATLIDDSARPAPAGDAGRDGALHALLETSRAWLAGIALDPQRARRAAAR